MRFCSLALASVLTACFSLPLAASQPASVSSAAAETAATRKPKKAPAPNYLAQLAAKLAPTRQIVYKSVGNQALHLDIFEPSGFSPADHRGAFITLHGGGWTSGTPQSMYWWAAHAADLGMVGISVQYRLYRANSDTTVFECVRDARSAVRYVRAHARELGIDPQKLVVNGASAGGHLAAATALFDGVDSAGDDTTVSSTPAALVLFSPVIDTSAAGYGNAKIGARWRELSPAHQVRPELPPTITFHGTGDTTTPFAGAELFHDAMLRAGNRSELVRVEGAIHTYMFKDAALHAETVRRLDAFLAGLGLVRAPTAKPVTR